jgi:hypothetical protein
VERSGPTRAARLRLIALLVGVPLLALAGADRALVGWRAQWAWAAREVPPLVLDPYRLEALLRTLPAGRANVLLLGNSVVEMGFDAEALDHRFADRGLRFRKLTQGGAPALSFGMHADAIAALEPALAVYVAGAPTLRSHGYLGSVHAYDLAAATELFTAAEALREPDFHLDGAVAQANLLARHRSALQRAALVRLGLTGWDALRARLDAAQLRRGFDAARAGGGVEGEGQWQDWVADPVPDAYPNPNTRALARLARRLREAGAKLLVMEAPTHPMQALLTPPRKLARYRAELAGLAAEQGFTLIPAAALPELRERDFIDWIHASERGRERLTAFLGDAVARAL